MFLLVYHFVEDEEYLHVVDVILDDPDDLMREYVPVVGDDFEGILFILLVYIAVLLDDAYQVHLDQLKSSYVAEYIVE